MNSHPADIPLTEETLFDSSDEYEFMLQQGLRLSGEDADYFLSGRIEELRKCLPSTAPPHRILDFGCGIGTAASHLAKLFPRAEVVGVDTSENALSRAQRERGSSRVSFRPIESLGHDGGFDLCYVNGVFHHIDPQGRARTVRKIYESMNPGGILALFENNPWNPGTRMVMRRIPFDKDAIPISIPSACRLVREGGFQMSGWRSIFYFPRALRSFRFSEPWLSRLPLGAQYYVLAVR